MISDRSPSCRHVVRIGFSVDNTAPVETAQSSHRVQALGGQELAARSENPWTTINIAAASMIRDDREAAFEYLTRAVNSGYPDYPFLDDPIFEPISADPRVRALIDRMTAEVTRQRARAADRALLELGSLVPSLRYAQFPRNEKGTKRSTLRASLLSIAGLKSHATVVQ